MAADRRRLILHVGLQKTGTSSIQLMLAGSRIALERTGYHYPELPNPKGAVWVSPFRHNIVAGTYADYHSAFDKLTPDEDHQFWQAIQESPLSPILSAEDFSRQRSFATLGQRLGPLTVRPVVYLRRQDAFIESLYNQRNKILLMRESRELLDPGLLSEDSLFRFIAAQDYRHVLNFERLTSSLESQLPIESMIVRLFDRQELVGGDICRDFAAVTGLDAAEMTMPQRYANESVSNAVLAEILAISAARGEEAALDRMRAVREAIQKGQSFGGSYRILTKDTRSALLRQYADINRHVEQRYGLALA